MLIRVFSRLPCVRRRIRPDDSLGVGMGCVGVSDGVSWLEH